MLNENIKENLTSKMPILAINTKIGIKFIKTSEILYLKANKKHSLLVSLDLKTIETTHPLKWYSLKLREPVFFRCHNSYLVNCYSFGCICGDHLISDDKISRIPLSRERKSSFINNIKDLYRLNELPESYNF